MADIPRTRSIQKAAARITTRSRDAQLDFSLLGNFQGVIDLDAEISNGAFQLGMAKQELNGPQVLRALVDQRRFGSPHGMRPID